MKILQLTLASVALLGLAGVASARSGIGGALPTVRKQVMTEAKSDGILKGLKRPSLRLDYSKTGKTVTATVMAMSIGGPVMLHPVERRMPMYSAKFKVAQEVEGKVATPVKQGGRVWQMFMRALAAK